MPPETVSLNSRNPLPSERPISGSRLAPNSSGTSTTSSTVSIGPISPITSTVAPGPGHGPPRRLGPLAGRYVVTASHTSAVNTITTATQSTSRDARSPPRARESSTTSMS